MIRQAHSYLVGAMGGATLIAIAIAVFVMLVSAQVFRDWPLAALGEGGDKSTVSEAKPAGGPGPAATARSAGAAEADGAGNGGAQRANATARDNGGTPVAANGAIAGTGAESVTPGQNGGARGAPVQGGGAQPPPTSSSPGSGGSDGAAGSTGGSGTVSSGGGKSTAGSGGGSGGGATTTTGQVTESVNNTVNQVDETALGGTLNESGVTDITEGAVNGVVGPESPVGKVVDETVGTVGGLLHGNR